MTIEDYVFGGNGRTGIPFLNGLAEKFAWRIYPVSASEIESIVEEDLDSDKGLTDEYRANLREQLDVRLEQVAVRHQAMFFTTQFNRAIKKVCEHGRPMVGKWYVHTQPDIRAVESVVSLVWEAEWPDDTPWDSNAPWELWGGDDIIAETCLIGKHEANRWGDLLTCYDVQVCFATWEFSDLRGYID